MALVASLGMAACGSSSPADDAGPPDDAPPSLPTAIQQTSGSGAMASPGYRATVRIGGPPPHETTTSDEHRAEPAE